MGDCWNLWMQNGMGSMMWMGLLWILLLIGIVYLIYKLFSNQNNRFNDKGRQETPLDILQKEFARGNISEEEYLKRKKHLE